MPRVRRPVAAYAEGYAPRIFDSVYAAAKELDGSAKSIRFVADGIPGFNKKRAYDPQGRLFDSVPQTYRGYKWRWIT